MDKYPKINDNKRENSCMYLAKTGNNYTTLQLRSSTTLRSTLLALYRFKKKA